MEVSFQHRPPTYASSCLSWPQERSALDVGYSPRRPCPARPRPRASKGLLLAQVACTSPRPPSYKGPTATGRGRLGNLFPPGELHMTKHENFIGISLLLVTLLLPNSAAAAGGSDNARSPLATSLSQ